MKENNGKSTETSITEYAGPVAATKEYKEQKFVALFKARSILAQSGTMAERKFSRAQLKRMKKLKLDSV